MCAFVLSLKLDDDVKKIRPYLEKNGHIHNWNFYIFI